MIDGFVDQEKLSDLEDVVLEKKMVVDNKESANKVLNIVDDLINDKSKKASKISYIKENGEKSTGSAALESLEEDLDEAENDELENDQEILEMVYILINVECSVKFIFINFNLIYQSHIDILRY